MSDLFSRDARWEILVARFVDGTLDESQTEQLETILNEKPELLKNLRDHLYQESLFCDLGKGRGEVPDALDLLGELGTKYQEAFEKSDTWENQRHTSLAFRKHRGTPSYFFVGLAASVSVVAVAILLVATAALWFRLSYSSLGQPIASARTKAGLSGIQENMSSAVAVTKLASDVVWEKNTDQQLKTGDMLSPGWLRLSSGLVVIEFFSGASIVIEGPAELQLLSNNRAYCAKGRVTADVPKQATGFRIDGPRMNVVDLGTSFCIDVSEGETLVNVIEGEIELHELPTGVKSLQKGEAVVVRDNGLLSHVNADESDVDPVTSVSQQTLENLKLMERIKQAEKWKKYGDYVNQIPELLIHFDFDQKHIHQRKIANTATHGQNLVPSGVMVDCRIADGPWEEKSALEFKRIADRFRFEIPGQFTELTMATWIRIDGIDRMYNSIFTTDGFSPGEVHWHVLWDGKIELGIYADAAMPGLQIRTDKVITPEKIGEWVHLAATIDTKVGEAILYMNGQVIHREKIEMAIPIQFKNAQLGNWTIEPTWDSIQPIRHLSGAIEEFLFFSQALTDEEINDLYEGNLLKTVVASAL